MVSNSSVSFPELPQLAGLDAEFLYWWNLPGEWVESPNQCRGGTSGVSRCSRPPRGSSHAPAIYLKRQVNHVYRTWKNPIQGLPTAAREFHFLSQMRQLGLNVPVPAYFAIRRAGADQYAVLATEALDGYRSLETLYEGDQPTAISAETDLAIRKTLAHYLARMHQARLQHGCLYPKHIFIRLNPSSPDHEPDIALIDLEKVRYRFACGKAASRDLAQFQRHQEFWSKAAWEEFLAFYKAARTGA